jgi:undecaprenyl diphosphate synthase
VSREVTRAVSLFRMTNVPQSIGIILDGNRRWARAHGLPTLEGHRRGYARVREITEAAFEAGVRFVTLYAFSTENWNRSPEEVSYLLTLFEEMINSEISDITKNDTRVRFIGDLSRFPAHLASAARRLEEKTKENKKGTVVVALSYGGRPEIVHAVNALLQEGREVVSEDDISKKLWTSDIPDPDLIIRPGGEKRLSNFLTWQSVYSELFFTDTFWPDFSKEELMRILEEFSKRERRHGT